MLTIKNLNKDEKTIIQLIKNHPLNVIDSSELTSLQCKIAYNLAST